MKNLLKIILLLASLNLGAQIVNDAPLEFSVTEFGYLSLSPTLTLPTDVGGDLDEQIGELKDNFQANGLSTNFLFALPTRNSGLEHLKETGLKLMFQSTHAFDLTRITWLITP